MIEPGFDAALAPEAKREPTSTAALVRRYVGERLRLLPPVTADPLWSMVGSDDFEPTAVDDVVYS